MGLMLKDGCSRAEVAWWYGRTLGEGLMLGFLRFVVCL